jgi:CSLREA domain-containing protein
MNLRRRVALTLLAALFALALPASASAVVYEVNTTADEAKKAECEAHSAGCTLRGAIEAANATAAVADTILFKASVFNGQLATATIQPNTPFPTIVSPLEINAATCGVPAGPCVGIKGPSASTAFTVTAENSSIYDLAIFNASTGIRVEAKKFTARGNWLGVDLEGKPGTAGEFGIAVSPNADEATIGGTGVVQRNVFANTTTGLQLRGASKAVIQGNYFGVLPDGSTAAANSRNLVVADSLGPLPDGTPATNNLIGADVESGSETAACDLGCNVFAGTPSGPSINLVGSPAFEEKAATGPTTISGNFVGLDATGTGELPNTGYGILAGAADHVTIGGPGQGAANYLVGGGEAIFSGNDGNDFVALGNSIGFRADGTAAAAPIGKGIYVVALSVTEEPEIDSNEIRVDGEAGIEVTFSIGRIIDNHVVGGTTGILAGFGVGGGLIASNTVESAAATGILIKSSNNEARDNTVIDSGGAGIAVKPPPAVTATIGNVIGGSAANTENVIEGSTGPAIEIAEEAGEPGSWTEITRNHGSGNGGLFIDLKNGANEGIVPPTFSSAAKASSEGTGAEPNATIRVFRKSSSAAGELQSFLGEAEADGSGNWKVTYPSVPGGTIVAATQTKEGGGTSELITATVPADPSTGGGGSSSGSGGGGNNKGGAPPATDTKAPTTTITKGPKAKSTSTTARFKFKANEVGSTFQCKLDKGKFKNCRSPKTYKKLKPGKHVFKVRATDKAGNVGRAATKKFTIAS